jgi:isochorismatase family protein
MNKLLLVIDVQNDFINENTRGIALKIEELINSNEYEYVVFTRFINDENSIWYNKLNYKGCMTKEGQAIAIDTKQYKIIDKTIYTALNKELEEYINENNIDEIYLCGFDTDACVQKTAIDLFENNYNVYVLKDYCISHKGIELHNVIINNLCRLIGRDKII